MKLNIKIAKLSIHTKPILLIYCFFRKTIKWWKNIWFIIELNNSVYRLYMGSGQVSVPTQVFLISVQIPPC